jgi:putative transcriptional regulator
MCAKVAAMNPPGQRSQLFQSPTSLRSPRMQNQLRALRVQRDLTQADVAARLKVSRQTVNALERGRRTPNLPLALRIAVLFERPVDEIFPLNSN